MIWTLAGNPFAGFIEGRERAIDRNWRDIAYFGLNEAQQFQNLMASYDAGNRTLGWPGEVMQKMAESNDLVMNAQSRVANQSSAGAMADMYQRSALLQNSEVQSRPWRFYFPRDPYEANQQGQPARQGYPAQDYPYRGWQRSLPPPPDMSGPREPSGTRGYRPLEGPADYLMRTGGGYGYGAQTDANIDRAMETYYDRRTGRLVGQGGW
jgi:hypothetical protein